MAGQPITPPFESRRATDCPMRPGQEQCDWITDWLDITIAVLQFTVPLNLNYHNNNDSKVNSNLILVISGVISANVYRNHRSILVF